MGKAFEADYSGVKPSEGGGFTLIRDKGPFLAKVSKVEPFMSKNQNPSVKCEWTIVNGIHDGVTLKYQNVTFLPKANKGAGISLHFLKQLREPFEGKFKIRPDDWVNKHAWITLGIEEYTDKDGNTRERNKIVNLKAPNLQELATLNEKPADWQTAAAAGISVPSTATSAKNGKAKPAPKEEVAEEDVPF